MDKLITMNVDITKRFPFNDDSFDGIFCTGTLHLFKYEILVFILGEIKRVLKNNGYFVLDFATNVERFDQNNNRVFIDGEGSYSTSDAIAIFKEQFLDYDIDIQIGNFLEENLEDSAGYKYISGEFLVVSGTKKRRIIIR